MAEGARRERGADTLRFADDAPADAPGASGGETGDQSAGLHGGHLFHGFRFQVAFPAGLAAVEDHLRELRIIRRGGEQAAVRHREAISIGCGFSMEEGQFRFLQTTCRGAVVGGDDAWKQRLVRIEAGVLHAERIEQALLQEIRKCLAGNHLDDARRGVDACLAILPLVSRGKQQRLGDDGRDEFRQRGDGFQLFRLEVAQPAGVGEALLDGDRRLVAGETGQVFGNRIVHGEFSLLLHHHHGGGGDRLGHRGDPEDRVVRHRSLGFEVGKSGGGEMQDIPAVRDKSHDTGDFAG